MGVWNDRSCHSAASPRPRAFRSPGVFVEMQVPRPHTPPTKKNSWVWGMWICTLFSHTGDPETCGPGELGCVVGRGRHDGAKEATFWISAFILTQTFLGRAMVGVIEGPQQQRFGDTSQAGHIWIWKRP